MKKEILVSIIIPTYNEEKLIGLCLASLQNQNFNKKDYEVIVVNNASTDNTVHLIQEFGVKIVDEPKKGVASAVKRGFLEARGKIIAITEADTMVPPDWILKIYMAFQDNPDVVLVGGRSLIKPGNHLTIIADIFLNYMGGKILRKSSACNFAIRRDIYLRIGGVYEEIDFNYETELFLRAKKEGKITFLWDNPVVTSSRHFKGMEGYKYCIRGLIGSTILLFFRKKIFTSMVDVR